MDRGESARIILVAHVKRKGNFTGNHIARAGRDFEFADGGQYSTVFGGKNKFRRTGKRIVTKIHRHGSGMSGDTVKFHAYPALSGDGGHDANGQIISFQHRALLDVNLRVAEKVAGFVSCSDDLLFLDARKVGGGQWSS